MHFGPFPTFDLQKVPLQLDAFTSGTLSSGIGKERSRKVSCIIEHCEQNSLKEHITVHKQDLSLSKNYS